MQALISFSIAVDLTLNTVFFLLPKAFTSNGHPWLLVITWVWRNLSLWMSYRCIVSQFKWSYATQQSFCFLIVNSLLSLDIPRSQLWNKDSHECFPLFAIVTFSFSFLSFSFYLGVWWGWEDTGERQRHSWSNEASYNKGWLKLKCVAELSSMRDKGTQAFIHSISEEQICLFWCWRWHYPPGNLTGLESWQSFWRERRKGLEVFLGTDKDPYDCRITLNNLRDLSRQHLLQCPWPFLSISSLFSQNMFS